MQKELKEALASRLDKYLSRETIVMILGLFGLLESHASAELWAIFSLVAIAILRGAKAIENIVAYKKETTTKTEKVESVVDTQDTPTDKPRFEYE